MAVIVSIPTALRKLTNNQPSVTVPAKTVGEMFAALTKQYPEIKKHLFTDDGQLRNFVRVYVNDEDIQYIAGGKDAPLKEGDTVTIVPSIAGGAEYDFSKGVRRKLYRKGFVLRLPIYLNSKLQSRVEAVARKRGKDIGEGRNEVVKKEMDLVQESA